MIVAALVVTSALVWAVLFLRIREFVFEGASEDPGPAAGGQLLAAMTLAFALIFALAAGAGALAAALLQRAPELGAMSGVCMVAVALGAVYVSGLSRSWDA